ncbi:MAG: sulfite exporter TauE/SafE family protein [Cyanobacteria bacterium P01_F01_bin.150]
MELALDQLSFILFSSLGITTGIIAGLLGIGGGMIIVPGLFYIFIHLHLPDETLMHMAAGTSMCIMIATSLSSTLAHQSRGNIKWSVFRSVIAGIGIGVFSGNLLANRLDSNVLELLFSLLLLSVSLKILAGWKPDKGEEKEPNALMTNSVGLAIGFKSGVFGVGGGALSVPFLIYCGLPMNKVSGTSASFTLPIAIMGTAAFLFLAPHYDSIPWSTGYVYWPAFLLVAPFTMIGAPVGAKLSTIMPKEVLRMIFAILLLFLSVKMFSSTEFWPFA